MTVPALVREWLAREWLVFLASLAVGGIAGLVLARMQVEMNTTELAGLVAEREGFYPAGLLVTPTGAPMPNRCIPAQQPLAARPGTPPLPAYLTKTPRAISQLGAGVRAGGGQSILSHLLDPECSERLALLEERMAVVRGLPLRTLAAATPGRLLLLGVSLYALGGFVRSVGWAIRRVRYAQAQSS